MSTIVSIDVMQVALTLVVTDLVLAMLMIGTVVVEGRIHNISRNTTSDALTDVVSEPEFEVVLGVQQILAVVHEDICTNANQATISNFIVVTAGHENVVEVAGVVSQVSDVPINQRVVDVARVDGHVGEVINDSVEDFEKVRQWIRLFVWLEWHAVLIESLHANSQRFGDIDVFDPLDKEPHDVTLVFDVVDEHVVIEAMEWCALFQKVLQILAHNELEGVAWDGVDESVVGGQSDERGSITMVNKRL